MKFAVLNSLFLFSNEQPEDELSVDDYKRHGDRNSEQFSDNARKDRLDTYDLPSHKKSHRERPRPQHDVRQVRSRDRHVNRYLYIII